MTIGSNVVIYRGTSLARDVLVADLASIRERVTIGESTIVGRAVTIEPKTSIGRRVTIQTASYITSDMVIEDEVFIGPCCSSSNDKYMGRSNYVHQGPIIKKRARIGNNATLLPVSRLAGSGSRCRCCRNQGCRDLQTVVGNPARPIAPRKEDNS